VTVDWHDGTTSTQTFTGNASGGNFVFTHFYASNPNSENQSAPIPVTITIVDDPNIAFTGLHQPAVTTPITQTETQTVGNGFHTIDTQITTPGSGLVFLNLAQVAIVISQLQLSPPNTLALSPVVPPVQLTQTQNVGLDATTFQESAVEEMQVILVVLDPNGKKTDEVEMQEHVLEDLPALFRQLPDGHYQIMLKEPGETEQRMLMEFKVRGGKPEDVSEGADGAALGAEQGALDIPAAPTTDTAEFGEPPVRGVGAVPAATALVDESVLVGQNGNASLDGIAVGLAAGQNTDSSDALLEARSEDSKTGAPAFFVAGALAGCTAGAWEERVDSALAEIGSNSLSKAARLARRLRRPVAADAIHRWTRKHGRRSISQ
jgi:hypothetical protein